MIHINNWHCYWTARRRQLQMFSYLYLKFLRIVFILCNGKSNKQILKKKVLLVWISYKIKQNYFSWDFSNKTAWYSTFKQDRERAEKLRTASLCKKNSLKKKIKRFGNMLFSSTYKNMWGHMIPGGHNVTQSGSFSTTLSHVSSAQGVNTFLITALK